MSDKARSKSVSLSGELWDLVTKRCEQANEPRSAYVRRIILADLEGGSENVDPKDPTSVVSLVGRHIPAYEDDIKTWFLGSEVHQNKFLCELLLGLVSASEAVSPEEFLESLRDLCNDF